MADRNEILLKEYEICQYYIDSIGSQVWSSTTIFLTVNVLLLTGIIYGTLTSEILSLVFTSKDVACVPLPIILVLGGIIVVGGGIIAILCRWIPWLRRMRFLTGMNYERMNAIERALGMERHLLVRRFDEKYNAEPPAKPHKPDTISRRYKYAPPRGFESLICIARTLIVLWAIFIVGIIYIAIALTLCWGLSF